MKLTHLLLTATFTLASLTAHAAVLISNFPPANDLSFTTIAASTGDFSKSAGFTLPVGDDYTLDSVVMRLEVNDLGATTTLSLFADVAGNPGGPALATFTTPALALGTADYTFLPTAAVTLNDATTYWIAATGISPTLDGITWRSSNPGITPTGIATDAGYRFNNNGTFPATGSNGSNTILNTYRVNATVNAVPETGTALFGLGLMGVAAIRRRR